MKPENIIKKVLHTTPNGQTEKDITPPIQITFLSDDRDETNIELLNDSFIHLMASHAEYHKFTGVKITIDDGKKSYTFTLNIDQFVPNQTEIRKPMK